MSDVSGGPDWWLATDGKWYPPELHPNYVAPPTSGAADQPASVPESPSAAVDQPVSVVTAPTVGDATHGTPGPRRVPFLAVVVAAVGLLCLALPSAVQGFKLNVSDTIAFKVDAAGWVLLAVAVLVGGIAVRSRSK